MTFTRGAQLLQDLLTTTPTQPGVYHMYSLNDQLLYIGKAKNLRNRIAQYTVAKRLSVRIQRMVSQIQRVEFIVTTNEVEALLLESNLIKKLKPYYNILLRDDKTFPYIYVTSHHDYPRLLKYRGKLKEDRNFGPGSQYFGPFTEISKVISTVETLQRTFKLRTCSDHVFAQRQRPCLQYFIQRCSAPCVGKISHADYNRSVEQAKMVLCGKNTTLKQQLQQQMQAASANHDYEQAAVYRDQLKALSFVHIEQNIELDVNSQLDVIFLHQVKSAACVQVMFFRNGALYGQYHTFPLCDESDTPADILNAFVSLFYISHYIPHEIVLSHEIHDAALIATGLSQRADKTVKVIVPNQGIKKHLLENAAKNAVENLDNHLRAKFKADAIFDQIATLFQIDTPLNRIETYDNSHLSGTNPYSAMVVATRDEGLCKSEYRLFKMQAVTAGDDYAMMRAVMQRRFKRLVQTPAPAKTPQLLIIDGGKGQLSTVIMTLAELQLPEQPRVVAIAKGPERNAGRETLFTDYGAEISLAHSDERLHYLQRLRDEAHRFVITNHRKSRTKQMTASQLDQIPGIGKRRKQQLLQHFGSVYNLEQASISAIAAAPGINQALAAAIYNYFHKI